MKKTKQPALFDMTEFDQAEKRQQFEDKLFGVVRPTPKEGDKCWYFDGSHYILAVVSGVSKSGKTFQCIELKDDPADRNLIVAWDIPAGTFKPFSRHQTTPVFIP